MHVNVPLKIEVLDYLAQDGTAMNVVRLRLVLREHLELAKLTDTEQEAAISAACSKLLSAQYIRQIKYLHGKMWQITEAGTVAAFTNRERICILFEGQE